MNDGINIILVIILICILSISICMGTGIAAYKIGQVDALNGKIKYELKVNDDKSSTWERIK